MIEYEHHHLQTLMDLGNDDQQLTSLPKQTSRQAVTPDGSNAPIYLQNKQIVPESEQSSGSNYQFAGEVGDDKLPIREDAICTPRLETSARPLTPFL